MAYLKRMKVHDFISLAGEVCEDLKENFKKVHRHEAGPSEINSWKNSLPELAKVLQKTSDAVKECSIYFEYNMPGCSSRADVFIAGLDTKGNRAGIVIELKQWDTNSIYIDGVCLKVGTQVHNHPSDQALGYKEYLTDLSIAFADLPSTIRSCSYLHNTLANDIEKFRNRMFASITEMSPMYAGDEKDEMAKWISSILWEKPDSRFLADLDSNELKVSKKLFDTVSKAIHEEPAWILLDKQRVAYDTINEIVSRNDGDKHLILVNGGPGTGKSVVAMQIMGDLCRKGISCVHVTNSSSFTTVIKSIIQMKRDRIWGSKAVEGLFKLSHGWVKNKPKFEVAICDEAHRFRKSTDLFQAGLVSRTPQALEIMENVRVMVAFLDEKQRLRKAEQGTIDYFKRCAIEAGVKRENIHGPIELDVQFRNAGNKEFLEALDRALYEDKQLGFSHQNFELTIHDSIEKMEAHLFDKIHAGNTVRLLAGFCWKWSDPGPDGSLVSDISIGNWTRAWNRKASGRENVENHPYTLWAKRLSDQLSEVGCIYSVQGFEFDYVGVIWGEDLVWRKDKWVAQPQKSYDKEIKRMNSEEALILLKNAYRVLCTRGMRGCAIYCLDQETSEYLKKALN